MLLTVPAHTYVFSVYVDAILCYLPMLFLLVGQVLRHAEVLQRCYLYRSSSCSTKTLVACALFKRLVPQVLLGGSVPELSLGCFYEFLPGFVSRSEDILPF